MRGRSRRLGGLLSWFFVALFGSTVLIQATPVPAKAATLNSSNNLTVKTRIYSEYMMLKANACAWKGGPLSQNDINAPTWFGGKGNVGLVVETEDGVIECDKSGWLAEILKYSTNTNYQTIYNAVPHSPSQNHRSSTLASYLDPMLVVTNNSGSDNGGGSTNGGLMISDIYAMQYAALLAAFTSAKGCGARQTTGDATANQVTANIYYYEPGVATNPTNFVYNKDMENEDVPVGYAVNQTSGLLKCSTIASWLEKDIYANAARDWYNADPTNRTVGGADTNVAGKGDACQNLNIVIGWMLCSIIKIIDGAISTLDSAMENLMIIDKSQYDNEGVKQAWRAMRNIALAILLPIMLVMVIGTALDYGPFDPYTARKAFPRLVFAVFFILLSYPFCVFLIELSNAAGAGLLGLVSAAFGQGTGNGPITLSSLLDGGDGIIFSIFTGAGAWVVFSGVAGPGLVGNALIFALVAVVGLLIGFLVLVLRQIIILAAIILAPVAILSWIFPGNDKLWKLWKESFQGALLFFVIFMAVVSVGRAFASLVDEAQFGIVQPFIILIAYVGPYFLIKQIAAMGGSALSTLSGMSHGASQGFFNNMRKRRQNNWERIGKNSLEGESRLGKSFIGEAQRRIHMADKGGLSLNRGKRDMYRAARQTFMQNVAAEKLKADGGRYAGDDIGMSLIEEGVSKEDQFLREYRSRFMTDNPTATAEEADAAAREALGGIRANFGELGSDAIAIAGFKARLASSTGVKEGEEGRRQAFTAASDLIRRGLISRVDAAVTIKSNRSRADLNSSFGSTLGALYEAQQNGGAISQATLDELERTAFEGADVGAIFNSHTKAVQSYATYLEKKIDRVMAGTDEDAKFRLAAEINGRHAYLNNTSPEKAQAYGKVLGRLVPGASDGSSITMRKYIEHLTTAQSGDSGQNRFRDLSYQFAQSAADATAAAAAAASASAAGTPPPPPSSSGPGTPP